MISTTNRLAEKTNHSSKRKRETSRKSGERKKTEKRKGRIFCLVFIEQETNRCWPSTKVVDHQTIEPVETIETSKSIYFDQFAFDFLFFLFLMSRQSVLSSPSQSLASVFALSLSTLSINRWLLLYFLRLWLFADSLLVGRYLECRVSSCTPRQNHKRRNFFVVLFSFFWSFTSSISIYQQSELSTCHWLIVSSSDWRLIFLSILVQFLFFFVDFFLLRSFHFWQSNVSVTGHYRQVYCLVVCLVVFIVVDWLIIIPLEAITIEYQINWLGYF